MNQKKRRKKSVTQDKSHQRRSAHKGRTNKCSFRTLSSIPRGPQHSRENPTIHHLTIDIFRRRLFSVFTAHCFSFLQTELVSFFFQS